MIKKNTVKYKPYKPPKLTKAELKAVEKLAPVIFTKLTKNIYIPVPDDLFSKGLDYYSYCEGSNGAFWALAKLIATREVKCNPTKNTSTPPNSPISKGVQSTMSIDTFSDTDLPLTQSI